jgi:uncharacterized protein (TIGR03437 family)
MIHARSRLALFVLAIAPLAQAQIRVLFLGPETDSAFAAVRSAANSLLEPGKRPALVISGLSPISSPLRDLVPLPAERAVQFARKRWPKEDVFVITPESAQIVGPNGLSSAFSALVHANQSQRRTMWRESHGVLFAASAAGLRKTGSQPGVPLRLRSYFGSALAAEGQGVTFDVDSDLCATFSRSGIPFDRACGYGPGRGINIAVINQITGEIEQIYDFDTWIDTDRAAQYAEQFIAQILPERLVLIAVADANFLDQIPVAVKAFQQRFGSVCVAQVDFRDSWVAVSENMKLLAEQCHQYSSSGDYVDSSVQYSLATAPSSDTTPPAGTFRINSGAPDTNSNLVNLDFTRITDAQSGLIPGGKVRLSNDGTSWSPMLDFSVSQNWVLDRGNGPKTVYAQFRDRAGNWSNTLTATITLKEQTPLRRGPDSSSFFNSQKYCTIGTRILALSSNGDAAISTDLGSDWSKSQSILPAKNDFGWDTLLLNCGASGTVLAAGFTFEDGNLLIATNSSSDGGMSWKASATTKSVAFSGAPYYASESVCSASPSNLAFLWAAQVGTNDQIFALASQDGGLTWPSTPVQLTNASDSTYVDGFTLQTSCSGSTVLAAVNGANGVSVYRSINGGGAFNAGIQVAPDAYNFSLVADPSGRIVLLAVSAGDGSTYALTARRSLDGGATWTLPVLVAGDLASYYNNLQAVAPASGQVYVAWVAQIAPDGSEALKVASSKDGAASWSQPVTVGLNKYFYSFMLAEKPLITAFDLAANSTGDVQVVWVDDRQGLYDGFTVQRYGVSAAARSIHEDQDIYGITDLYAATSTDFGATWKIAGPLQPDGATGTDYIDSLALSLTADGTAVTTWGREGTYLDVRFLNGSSLPLVDPGGPLNAASLKSANLAPGSMAIVSGQNLAANAASAQPPHLPTNLSDVSIRITDSTGTTSASELYDVASNQIRFVVPESAAGGIAEMRITTSHGSLSVPISIAGVAPGLFSTTHDGAGTPAGWTVQTFADGSVRVTPISPGVPIALSSDTVSLQLTVLATGAHHASNVKLMIGGVPLDQATVSGSPDWPGLDQVSGFVPKSLKGAGSVGVYMLADGVSSNSLNLTFK